MDTRTKALLGVSVLALLSGAAPLAPALMAPMTDTFGLANPLFANAEAQESGEGEEATPECTTEGEEGGSADCTPPEDEGEG